VAKHRKKANRTARAGCHYCKPWKLRLRGRTSPDFESFSAHRRRVTIGED